MEQSSLGQLQGRADGNSKDKVAESVQPELDKIDDDKEHHIYQKDNPEITGADIKVGSNVRDEVAPAYMDCPGELNMEAAILADDVIRAGGFGAIDDISSFLPAASDSTDFEASLLYARDYEEPQEEIRRPGLGWEEAQK